MNVGDQLQRVHNGAITTFGGYFENCRRIFSSPVTSGFDALVETGYLYLQSSRPPELDLAQAAQVPPDGDRH